MPTWSKRAWLAGQLQRWGLLSLLALLARRRDLLVLNYHRIGSPAGHLLDDGVLSATPDDFRAQVRCLRELFDLPPVEEVLRAVAAGCRFARPTALITFDDGYRDNVTLALPVLRELGVPALFFICTGFVSDNPLPVWDRISYVFKKAPGDSLALDYPFAYRVSFTRTPRSFAAERYFCDLSRCLAATDLERFFAHLEARAVAVPVDTLRQGLFATWDEVRLLAESGMTVGAHTLTHPPLAQLSEDRQRHELVASKRLLEERLGRPVSALSYPFGDREFFDARTKRLAREAGYLAGFSYYGGSNAPGQDPFDVRRVSVDADVTVGMFRSRVMLYRALGQSFV
jgi:peptidoglycan/xylan/chitin deacetylase (PgdA/CDA1 family)